MKLYMVPLAPNPTKVMLYIAERAHLGTDLPIEQVVVNTLKGRHREPAHLARNPFGTLPVLELEDGSHILESLAIIQYLEERFPDGALLRGTTEERAHARDLERIADVRLAIPMGQYAHAKKSPLGYPPQPELAAQIEDSLATPLDYMEAQLTDGRPNLTGPEVSLADCTLQAALQFIRFIEADLIGDRTHLRAWDQRYRERPAAQSVLRW